MEKTETDAEEEVAMIYDRYGKMLYRMCMVILGNRQDAEDAVQDTFAKYLKTRPVFREAEHEKAWFLRVAENRCRDKRHAAFFRHTVSLEELGEYAETPEESEVISKLAELPPRSRSVLYLHYVEGYRVREIAQLLHIREGAAKTALCRAREALRNKLKEEPA